MDSIRKICSTVGFYDESPLREVVFAAAAYHCSGNGLISTIKRFNHISKQDRAKTILLGKITTKICQFIGDKFNNYIGDFPPEELIVKDIMLGTIPSDIVQEALQHECREFNGGLTEEALEYAERFGIIAKKTFYAFANVAAKAAQEEAEWALELKNTPDQQTRSQIREKMIEVNIYYQAIATCLAKHILNPNEQIAAVDSIDIDFLKKIYPEQFDLAKGIILSYSNAACVNRILREGITDRIEQDAVIAILERDGKYTDEFKQAVKNVSDQYLGQKTIPHKALPPELQEAIQENQERIYGAIDKARSGVLNFLYKTVTKIHVLGGAVNRVGRIAALDAGRHRELQGSMPRRY